MIGVWVMKHPEWIVSLLGPPSEGKVGGKKRVDGGWFTSDMKVRVA